jgi:hypothetical protein
VSTRRGGAVGAALLAGCAGGSCAAVISLIPDAPACLPARPRRRRSPPPQRAAWPRPWWRWTSGGSVGRQVDLVGRQVDPVGRQVDPVRRQVDPVGRPRCCMVPSTVDSSCSGDS